MELHLIRHGPKNKNPAAHGTGVEALLDPERAVDIIGYGYKFLNSTFLVGRNTLYVESTPVPRAVATANIVQKVFTLDPRFQVPEPSINNLIGSYICNPTGTEIINLSPMAMSDVWAKAKKEAAKEGRLDEDLSLYEWCKEGFDNPKASISRDPGISLREIACRIGAYVHSTLTKDNSLSADCYFAIGHSGDIEPFLYLTLEMLQKRDGSDYNALLKYFPITRALTPLTGLSFYTMNNGRARVDIHRCYSSLDEGLKGQLEEGIPLNIFEQQANWLRDFGKSKLVLEQKIAAGK